MIQFYSLKSLSTLFLFILFFPILGFVGLSQTNVVFTTPSTEQLIKGNYNPSNYLSSSPINQHDAIVSFIQNNVNADSLKS